MKKKLYLFLCITALSVLPLWADDASKPDAPKTLTVEQRLREIDLSVTLREYERVKTELAETDLKRLLLQADGDLTEADLKKQAEVLMRRRDTLDMCAVELREEAKSLGNESTATVAKSK
jgi:hypothetical protein